MSLQSYRELEVWRVAIDLVEQCYRVTRPFTKDEHFGLTSQIRRAAVSIPANIAEGYGRLHPKEYLNHLSIARGSLKELETHLVITQRVGLLDSPTAEPLFTLADRIGQMLTKLIQSLQSRL
jgi:four helix bundle protein